MNLSAEFEKWGRVLVIENTDSTQTAPFKGFIQPLRYKNKMYLNGINTVIGFNSQGHYLYIGPPDHDPERESCHVESNGKKYTVDRCEKVYFKNEVIYVWAIIREIVEVE